MGNSQTIVLFDSTHEGLSIKILIMTNGVISAEL
jgi:hypothetical protein